MTNVEYVSRPSKVTFSGVFSLNDLYALIKRWHGKHNFDPIEKEHAEVQRGEGKDYFLKFESERDEDDYRESVMEITIRGEDLVPVKRKDQRLYEGKITVSVRALLRRDIKNKWRDSFWMHFMRSIWDKWGISPEYKKYHEELSQEAKDLVAEIKSFFDVEKHK